MPKRIDIYQYLSPLTMKRIPPVYFEDSEMDVLLKKKDGKTWREAILEWAKA